MRFLRWIQGRPVGFVQFLQVWKRNGTSLHDQALNFFISYSNVLEAAILVAWNLLSSPQERESKLQIVLNVLFHHLVQERRMLFGWRYHMGRVKEDINLYKFRSLNEFIDSKHWKNIRENLCKGNWLKWKTRNGFKIVMTVMIRGKRLFNDRINQYCIASSF